MATRGRKPRAPKQVKKRGHKCRKKVRDGPRAPTLAAEVWRAEGPHGTSGPDPVNHPPDKDETRTKWPE